MTSWTVVKLGGSLLDDSVQRLRALATIGEVWRSDSRLVLVHGGERRIDSTLVRLGIPKRSHLGRAVLLTSDFGHDYVALNSDYRS